MEKRYTVVGSLHISGGFAVNVISNSDNEDVILQDARDKVSDAIHEVNKELERLGISIEIEDGEEWIDNEVEIEVEE